MTVLRQLKVCKLKTIFCGLGLQICALMAPVIAFQMEAQDLSDIVAAEYYWDADYGTNHVAVPIAADQTTGVGYPGSVPVNIDLSGLAAGLHQLAFRVQDRASNWSAISWLPVQVYNRTNAVTPLPATSISDTNTWLISCEYFWDSDPGVGHGTSVSIPVDEMFGIGYPGALATNVDLSSLSLGPHKLGFRTIDQQGRVSQTSWLPVQVYNPTNAVTASSVMSNNDSSTELVSAEYFWDTNVAVGAGSNVSIITDEVFGIGYPSMLATNVDLSSLSLGLHKLGFRTVDNQGRVSQTSWLPVQVITNPVTAPPVPVVSDTNTCLISSEYFWDGDPGVGHGTSVSIPVDEMFGIGYPGALATNVDLSSLSLGLHKLGFRTIDNQGRVSQTSWLPVQVYNPTNAVTASSVMSNNDNSTWLVSAEYFWDTNVTVGTGSNVSIITDEVFGIGYPSMLATNVDLSSLSLGLHKLGVRTVDSQGRASQAVWLPVQVYNPTNAVTVARVIPINDSSTWLVSAEYFWDSDPGAGNGMPVSVGPDETLAVGYPGTNSLTVDLPAIDGNHTLGFRTKNALGQWSVASFLPVEVTGPPEITCQPQNVVVGPGTNVIFSVCAAGSPPLSYQWIFDGTSLADNGRITGSQTSSLTIGSAVLSDVGGYEVTVSNNFGSVTSATSTLSFFTGSGFTATHAMPAYVSPGTNAFTCQFSYPTNQQLYYLYLQPNLPNGWTLLSVAGDGSPEAEYGQIVFEGSPLPNPINISCIVYIPSGEMATNAIVDDVYYYLNGMDDETNIYASPNPLLVPPAKRHSDDYEAPFWVIDGAEVSWELAYWRAQAYHVASNNRDGYAPGPGSTNGRLNSADYEAPFWVIDGTEVNRVLAYWRAGAYHPDTTGADGYAPGPMVPTAVVPVPAALVDFNSPDFTFTESGPALYTAGSTVSITNSVSYNGTLLSLLWRPSLPGGWTVVSASAPGNPEIVAGEIVWTGTLPGSPFQLVYNVQGPANDHAPHNLSAAVEYQLTGTVNPSVISNSATAPLVLATVELEPPEVEGNLITIIVAGESGRQYYIQRSTNLLNWQTIATVTANGGTATLQDAATNQQSFYRAALAGP